MIALLILRSFERLDSVSNDIRFRRSILVLFGGVRRVGATSRPSGTWSHQDRAPAMGRDENGGAVVATNRRRLMREAKELSEPGVLKDGLIAAPLEARHSFTHSSALTRTY